MLASTPQNERAVQIGRFSYSHNRFLILLACIGALAYVVADAVGLPIHSGSTGMSKLAEQQMIWAALLVPIAVFGAWALKRAGHPDSALSCGLIAASFMVGACVRTFLL
ncbi:hypothetical protein [Pseudomonas sp. NPDC089569]|uniref:hypothetical protein n=1 Tax=Pseudomonas sp. NPDC089569 TaxID=3390722 RepID=UPI003D046F6A